MIKRINKYLLTHYPLLWNTRIVWVIAVAIILHTCFFLSGLTEVTTYKLQDSYGSRGFINFSLVTFSLFTSLIFIIAWLVFYLRNNAYKNYYTINKWYNVKQYFIILLGFLFIIPFFESYHYGTVTGIKKTTNKSTLTKEINITNQALAFIPDDKSDYFILNTCNVTSRYNNDLSIYTDTTLSTYNTIESSIVKKASLKPDAYSYKNYCQTTIYSSSLPGYNDKEELKKIRDRWLDNHQQDSVLKLLKDFTEILRKYNIKYNFNPEYLSQLPFKDSLHTISRVFENQNNHYNENQEFNNPEDDFDFFSAYGLSRTLNTLEEAHTSDMFENDETFLFLLQGYFIVCFSLLLFSYKLYTRKVFLISIVSIIITAIFIGLMAAAGTDNTFPYLLIFIWLLFSFIALVFVKSFKNKTMSGVFLNLHLYMFPFLILCLSIITNKEYENIKYAPRFKNGIAYDVTDAFMKSHHPFLYWVNNNIELITLLNLIIVVLYTAFVFTRLSKKWHLMPDE